MIDERREELASLVVPGSGLPYVLPDPSMSLLSSAASDRPHTPARRRTSIHEHPDSGIDFATISVGSDRGLFRVLAMSESLTYTTVAGMPAFRGEQSRGVVIFVWPATAGQWAQLVVSGTLADRADDIAASVVPDQTELLPPGMTPSSSNGATAESDALAEESLSILNTLGWPVTLEEHETRTTAEGIEVNWAYFSEPGRRLFVVSGPADLLSTVPDLQRQLGSTSEPGTDPAIWVWPQETWLTTQAAQSADRTIIFRSEGIDRTEAARSRADMDALVQAAISAHS